MNNEELGLEAKLRTLISEATAPSWQFWRDRKGALRQIRMMGIDARMAIPALCAAFGRLKNWSFRTDCAETLGLLASPMAEFVGWPEPETWKAADAAMRRMCSIVDKAYETETQLEYADRVVDALVPSLSDPEYEVAGTAAMGLCAVGPGAKSGMAALADASQDGPEAVRCIAGAALANITRQDTGSILGLANIVADTKCREEIRRVACWALLYCYGLDRHQAVPQLAKAVSECAPNLSGLAVWTLEAVLWSAKDEAGDLGEVTSALVRALESGVAEAEAASALVKIGPAIVPYLVPVLEGEHDIRVKLYTARALGCIGPRARSAVNALRNLRQNDMDGIVAKALARIGRH